MSLIEELEAVDWYDQRIDATEDEALRDVLRHNRDEEKEHASMVLEWLRRHDPTWDRFLRFYLFTERPIDVLAEEAEEADAGTRARAAGEVARGADGSLGLLGLADKEML